MLILSNINVSQKQHLKCYRKCYILYENAIPPNLRKWF